MDLPALTKARKTAAKRVLLAVRFICKLHLQRRNKKAAHLMETEQSRPVPILDPRTKLELTSSHYSIRNRRLNQEKGRHYSGLGVSLVELTRADHDRAPSERGGHQY